MYALIEEDADIYNTDFQELATSDDECSAYDRLINEAIS